MHIRLLYSRATDIWHTFDIDPIKDQDGARVVSDATIDALLDALQLPRNYAWVWRGLEQPITAAAAEAEPEHLRLFSRPPRQPSLELPELMQQIEPAGELALAVLV